MSTKDFSITLPLPATERIMSVGEIATLPRFGKVIILTITCIHVFADKLIIEGKCRKSWPLTE